MIEREDIDHNIFILRLIIRRKFGVEAESLNDAMRQMKRKLPRRSIKAAGELVRMSEELCQNETEDLAELSEFEKVLNGLIDDLVYYDPQHVMKRKLTGGRWEAVVHLGLASVLLLFFLQWQGFV